MADRFDTETRSRMMSANRRRDTRPELIVRRGLHRRGFRFRVDVANMPGRPDLVLRKHHAVIFVHGCFWHRHEGCRFAYIPETRREFWQGKFEANLRRDKRNEAAIVSLGWRVAIVWECALEKRTREGALNRIEAWLASDERHLELGREDLAQSADTVRATQ
jgi:DNA mismatch endonuclease (patch repair protein)